MPEVLTEVDEQLSGRDLDAAVAERVMKWTPWDSTQAYRGPLGVTLFDTFDDGGQIVVYRVAEKSNTFNPSRLADRWSPAQNISAAMEVAEKMRSEGWSFACTLYEGKLPYASFCKKTAASSRNAESETLPEAICRAALKAVGAE